MKVNLEKYLSLLHWRQCLWLILPFIFFLSGCDTVVKPSADDFETQKQMHQKQLQSFQNWKVTGRVAFKKANDAWHATLQYKHSETAWRLRLIAPLGQGSFEISGSESGVILKDHKNRLYQSGNAGQLLFETLGWRMPVTHLESWIKGYSPLAANDVHTLFDEQARLSVFKQDGWKVELSSYIETGKFTLPEHVFLSKGDVSLKIIVSKWLLLK